MIFISIFVVIMALTPSKSDLTQLANRYVRAMELLKGIKKLGEIADLIKKSPGYLSQLKDPDRYKLTENSYRKIFYIIDGLIQEHLNKAWNEKSGSYESIDSNQDVTARPASYNPRVEGLIGNWKGFSWNNNKTKTLKQNFFNVFKLSIGDLGKVVCELEKSKLKGDLIFLGNNRLVFQLESATRKLFILGPISIMDDLSIIDNLSLTYIDSGDRDSKCGLVLLKKTAQKFEEIIKPFTYCENDLADLLNPEKEYLKESQNIVMEYDLLKQEQPSYLLHQ